MRRLPPALENLLIIGVILWAGSAVYSTVWRGLSGDGSALAAEIVANESLIMLDFTATWCNACRPVVSALDSLGHQYYGKVAIVRINVDANPDLVRRYGVHAIPCILLFKDRIQVGRKTGAKSVETYREWIDEHLEQF